MGEGSHYIGKFAMWPVVMDMITTEANVGGHHLVNVKQQNCQGMA